MSLSSQTALDVFLIVSNLALWIPSAQAFVFGRYTRFVLFFLMGIASALYHLCDSFPSACLFSFSTHNHLDFFFAQLIIPVSALYLIYFPPRYYWVERFLILAVFAPGVWVITISMGNALWVQGVIVAASFLLVGFYWAWYAHHSKQVTGEYRFPPYSWGYLVLAIALTGLSVSLFSVQNIWHRGYWAIHSLWHVLAAEGQYFLLKIRKEAPKFVAVDSPIIGNSVAGTGRSLQQSTHCLVCLGSLAHGKLAYVNECGHCCAHVDCIEMAYKNKQFQNCPVCRSKIDQINVVS